MKRIVSLVMLVLLSTALAFAGGVAESSASSSARIPDTLQPNDLPIARGDVSLTLYSHFPPGARQVYESLADSPVAQIMMEETGINMSFVHTP